MKRLYIAVILLLFVAAVCTTEFIYINHCANNITDMIDNISRIYEEGKKERAMKLALETEENWKIKVSKIDMLLYHDYVDDITRNIVNLKTYIEEDDTVGLYSTCNETITQIYSLKNSEFPSLENII